MFDKMPFLSRNLYLPCKPTAHKFFLRSKDVTGSMLDILGTRENMADAVLHCTAFSFQRGIPQ